MLTVTKTRFPEIEGVVVDRPGSSFMAHIVAWLGAGEEVPVPEAADGDQISTLIRLLVAEDVEDRTIQDVFRRVKSENQGVLPAEWVAGRIEAAEGRAQARLQDAAETPQEAISDDGTPDDTYESTLRRQTRPVLTRRAATRDRTSSRERLTRGASDG